MKENKTYKQMYKLGKDAVILVAVLLHVIRKRGGARNLC